MVRYLQLSIAGMFVSVGLPLLVVAGLGAYPTWRFAGWEGMRAEGFALAQAALVFFSAAAVVFRLFREQGGAKIGYGFVVMGPIRVLAIAILTVVTWVVAHPVILYFAGWSIGFYLVALASESVWLTKALPRAMAVPSEPHPGEEMKKD